MSESNSKANKNSFSEVVNNLAQERKALIKERKELKSEDLKLKLEEENLKEAQESLNISRLAIEQALARWTVINDIVESKEGELRDKRKAFNEKKTRIQEKINLFERFLPLSTDSE
ncbi:hypothetical protein INT46_000526 [Mucor plumbeus]|uniref:Uncharacterized protein n=1 Tax=Mucor plumbeus TaxID=97098 RepID=A0A8H7UX58_9FUNG|nr:hypothetical protein INT46_000526 [Mucor plumbeus]